MPVAWKNQEQSLGSSGTNAEWMATGDKLRLLERKAKNAFLWLKRTIWVLVIEIGKGNWTASSQLPFNKSEHGEIAFQFVFVHMRTVAVPLDSLVLDKLLEDVIP